MVSCCTCVDIGGELDLIKAYVLSECNEMREEKGSQGCIQKSDYDKESQNLSGMRGETRTRRE